MTNRFSSYLSAVSAAVLLLLAGSCNTKEPVRNEQGRIAVSISSGMMATRALSDDIADGSAIILNGSGVPDLAIGIANSDGDLVACWPDDYWDALGTTFTSECQTSQTDSSKSTIYFTGPGKGLYTVFAVANTAGLNASTITALKAAKTVDALNALLLSVASGEPDFGATMPLTAKGSLTINSWGNGQIDLNLLRPVAKISFTFVNETGGSVDIHGCTVTLRDLNTSSGYLFEQDPDYLPDHTYDRDLKIAGADPLVFTDNKSTLPIKTVFPSEAPPRLVGSRYFCDVSFRVTKKEKVYSSGDATTYSEYTFENLPIHDNRSKDIPYILRNQHLKIETRITKRSEEHDYSFNFEVQDWYEKEAYVTFD